MDKIYVTGGTPLNGTITISGSKNAALPLMATSLLTADTITLSNVPHIADISTMAHLLLQHGTNLLIDASGGNGGHLGGVIQLTSDNINNIEAPYDLVRKMRASVLVLGPLLARFGKARVSLPGGCAIGTRPIDMHLKALTELGAVIELTEGYIDAHVPGGKLTGTDIHFGKISVGATENALMAATLATGTTTIHNAAKEPEITDLANCLVSMGANIDGIGTHTLTINGVESLHGTHYKVICDRIEAGTFMMAAAATRGTLTLEEVDLDVMTATIELLKDIGVHISTPADNTLKVDAHNATLSPKNVSTEAYPGFATDLQAQYMALMLTIDGSCIIEETIFENRFMHVAELSRMGADILIEGYKATVHGGKPLKNAELMATDLRASVCLVIAALAAQGDSVINRMYHIDRGYERIEEKLAKCGAKIRRAR